jgi:hypothetical protein
LPLTKNNSSSNLPLKGSYPVQNGMIGLAGWQTIEQSNLHPSMGAPVFNILPRLHFVFPARIM